MKKLFFGLAAAMLLVGCGEKEDPDTIRMVTEPSFPPYEFKRGDETVGIDVEICRAVAEKLGKKFKIETVDFDKVIPSVASGEADIAAAGITVTSERRKLVDFSIPYVNTGVVVIYEKGDTFKSIENLKGRKVGVQTGTTSEHFVAEHLDQEPHRFRTTAEACAALKSGDIDYVMADMDTAKSCVSGDSDIEFSNFLSYEEYAIAVKKGRSDLVKAINQTIYEVRANGDLDKWIAKYTAEAHKRTAK